VKLEETYYDRHDLIGITVSTFSRTEDNLTQDRPSPAQLSYRTAVGCKWDSLVLEKKWAIIHFKMRRNLKFFYISVVVYVKLPFLWNMTPLHPTLCSYFFGQFSGHKMSAEYYVLTPCQIPEERNVLYICLKMVNFGVQPTTLCSIRSYICQYTSEVTAVEQDNWRPISTRSSIGR